MKNKWIKYGDMAGMAASLLCLVHCLAMPVVVFAFPMMGEAHTHDGFHNTILALIALPVLVALIPGYMKHRDLTALVTGCIGLAAFLAAVFIVSPLFGEAAEAGLAIVSGVLLLFAHVRNFQHCRRCVDHVKHDAACCSAH